PPPPQRAAASRLLRAGPPASAASVLNASGFRLGTLPLATSGLTLVAVSTLAFSRSVQEPQTRLTPPLRRTPPGQERGHPPGPSRGTHQNPRFRCHLQEFRRLNSARPTGNRPSASGTSS